MGAPEVPIVRLLLYLDRRLLEQAVLRELQRLEALPTGGGVLIFEGLFHLLRASMVFTRASEDVATVGIYCAPLDEGVIRDAPASGAQMDLVAARLLTFWESIKGFYSPDVAYDRLVFHDAGPLVTNALGRLVGVEYDTNGHRLPGQPPANPALRTDVLSGHVGTSAATRFLPQQVAMSITEKTRFRRQWGRIYLPAPDVNAIAEGDDHASAYGEIASGTVDNIRTYAGTLLDGLHTDGVPWVVWSTKHQHALSVDQVQVDSIFDVIRSRRIDRASHIATHTLTP